MELLHKYFPMSFTDKKDLSSLAVILLLHLVVLLAVGVVVWLLNLIPIVRILGWIAGSAALAYVVAGTALTVLDHFKIVK